MLLDQPRLLLRAEGLAILAGAAVLYVEGDYNWLLFAILFLAPDLSFAASAAGPRVGAAGYNLVHNLVLPIGLTTYGVLDNSRSATAVGLIWLAHIGIDRTLGYGLKYPTTFKDTHLQRV